MNYLRNIFIDNKQAQQNITNEVIHLAQNKIKAI